MPLAEREKESEGLLHRQVKKRGGFTRKWSSKTTNGVPDRLVFMPGLFGLEIHIVENKSPTGTLSATQKKEIRNIVEHGGRVYVVYGKEGVYEWLDDLDNDRLLRPHPEPLDSKHAGAVVYPARKRLKRQDDGRSN